MVLEGRVAAKNVNVGSKSEHEAAVLVTKRGEYKLRMQGGHPFSDPEVRALIGKRIRAEGFLSSGQFIMKSYQVITQ